VRVQEEERRFQQMLVSFIDAVTVALAAGRGNVVSVSVKEREGALDVALQETRAHYPVSPCAVTYAGDSTYRA
jgi:hypothetical protein